MHKRIFGGFQWGIMTTKKGINASILVVLIPVILENILVFSASAVTTAMVGRLTAIDISAQGIGARLMNIYLALFKGLAIGLTVTGALRFGEGDLQRWRKTVNQAFLTAVPMGLIFCAAVFLFPAWCIRLFTSDVRILAVGCPYVRLVAVCYPFLAISAFVTGAFQSRNDTKTPMIIAGIVNTLNILLGWILIFGKLGVPALGLMGAGIAFVTAQLIGASIGLTLLFNKKIGLVRDVELNVPFCKFDRECAKEIYAMGFPAACENLQWHLATVVLSRVILLYGVNSYAAYQLGLQAEGMLVALASGFIVASATLAANAIGKRDEVLYHGYFWQLTKICLGVSLVGCCVLFFAPHILMRLLTDKEDLIEIGIKYLTIMAAAQIPQNMSKVLAGTIRAAGYKRTPFAVTATGVWGGRVLLCVLFGYVFKLDIIFIWWAFNVDQIMRMLLGIWVIVHKRILGVIRRLPPVETVCPSGELSDTFKT